MNAIVEKEKLQSFEPYTCLISLYDKEDPDFLTTCLDSVISQTVPPEEILIVKDGSLTDELESILLRYSEANEGLLSFVSYEQNKGLWYALSVGVPACRNELIMRMDIDDWTAPSRAEQELVIMSAHPEIGCVGTLVTEFEGTPDNPIALVDLPEFHNEIVKFGKKRCPFRHPSLMYRKSAVMKAGNYQKMPLFEDYDLYMRLVRSGCIFYNIQERLVYMRTSQDFYARRGSFDYMLKMLNFKCVCLKRKDYSFGEFLLCTLPHIAVCLMPDGIRTWIYKKLLRSTAPKLSGEDAS